MKADLEAIDALRVNLLGCAGLTGYNRRKDPCKFVDTLRGPARWASGVLSACISVLYIYQFLDANTGVAAHQDMDPFKVLAGMCASTSGIQD